METQIGKYPNNNQAISIIADTINNSIVEGSLSSVALYSVLGVKFSNSVMLDTSIVKTSFSH
jgi:hypothetical protein